MFLGMARHRRPLPLLPSSTASEESKALGPARSMAGLEEAVAYLIKTRRSENTKAAYTLDWKRWLAFATIDGLDLTAPTVMDAMEYHAELKVEYGVASVARKLSTLAFFYRALQAAGLVKVNPFDSAWLPRDEVATGITRAVALEDVDQLLRTIKRDRSPQGLRDMVMLRLLHETGARRASVRGALRSDVDLATNTLRVLLKGRKYGLLSFTEECAVAVRQWLAIAPESRFMFPSDDLDEHGELKLIDHAVVNKMLTDRCIEAGVKHIHPHQFRSAFITDGYSAGVPERDVQTAAHHADAAMTRKYDRGVRGERVVDKIAAYRQQQREQRKQRGLK